MEALFTRPSRLQLTWFSRPRLSRLTSILMVAALWMPVAEASGGVDVKIVDPPQPLELFNLKDGKDQPFSNDQLKGKWSLVLLGFTHCPDVCPMTMANLAHVVEALSVRVSPSRLPQVVFVGVDPDRDRPLVGSYVKNFNDNFIGVSGEWGEIKKLVTTLGGYARIERKKAGSENYRVLHSAVVSLVDANGRLVAGINPPMEPNAAAVFISQVMLKSERSGADAAAEKRSH